MQNLMWLTPTGVVITMTFTPICPAQSAPPPPPPPPLLLLVQQHTPGRLGSSTGLVQQQVGDIKPRMPQNGNEMTKKMNDYESKLNRYRQKRAKRIKRLPNQRLSLRAQKRARDEKGKFVAMGPAAQGNGEKSNQKRESQEARCHESIPPPLTSRQQRERLSYGR